MFNKNLLVATSLIAFFSASAMQELRQATESIISPEISNRITTGAATIGTMFTGYALSAFSKEFNKANEHAHRATIAAVHTSWLMSAFRSLKSLITAKAPSTRDAALVGATFVTNFIFPYIVSKCNSGSHKNIFEDYDDHENRSASAKITTIIKTGLWGAALTTGALVNIALIWEGLRT